MTFHTTDGLRPNAPVALTRRAIDDEIERLIALLDALDPDLEPNGDELDASWPQSVLMPGLSYPGEDFEPYLAGLPTCQEPGDCDRELDDEKEPWLARTECIDQSSSETFMAHWNDCYGEADADGDMAGGDVRVAA